MLLESQSQTPILCKRKRADWLGLKHYYTGKPCSRGHIAERMTASGNCMVCLAEKAKAKYWEDPVAARKKATDARARNPEKKRARQRELYYEDRERHLEYAKKARQSAKTYDTMTDEPIHCRKCDTVKTAENFTKDKYRKNGRKNICRACVANGFSDWLKTDGYERRLKGAKVTRDTLKNENPKLRWAQVAKNSCKARAKLKGIEFSLTVEWLLAAANEMCPLLEIPLNYQRNSMCYDSPAVDRKDNDGGYTQDNCWVISTKANRIKTNATPDEVLLVGKNLKNMLG